MNGVSSVGFSAYPAVSKRSAVTTSPQVLFGDDDAGKKIHERLGMKYVDYLLVAIVAVTAGPVIEPIKDHAKKWLWRSDDSEPGVVGRQIHKAAKRVKKVFSRKTETLEEQLEKLKKQDEPAK
jgi:hypothetical protein